MLFTKMLLCQCIYWAGKSSNNKMRNMTSILAFNKLHLKNITENGSVSAIIM